MERHVHILGLIYVVYHGIGVLFALGLFVLLGGIGIFSGDLQAMGILGLLGIGIASLVTIFAAPGIIAGVGLLKHRRWARVLSLVIGFISLFEFPLGTALGIYTFWVLTHEETQHLFPRPVGI